MSNVLTSLGVKFYIGARETDSLNEPEDLIPQVIESSEIDLDPDTIETTSFDNLRYKSSVAGLIDTSGIQALTVNATEDEEAEAVWDAYAGKPAWLKIVIPNKADNTYIPIIPIKTGAYNVVINDRITIRLKYTIAGDMLFGESLSNTGDVTISGRYQFKSDNPSVSIGKTFTQNVNITANVMGDTEEISKISGNVEDYKLYFGDTLAWYEGTWQITPQDYSYLDFGSTPQAVSQDFLDCWNSFAQKSQ